MNSTKPVQFASGFMPQFLLFSLATVYLGFAEHSFGQTSTKSESLPGSLVRPLWSPSAQRPFRPRGPSARARPARRAATGSARRVERDPREHRMDGQT